VGFVANVNARGIRMHNFQSEIFTLYLSHHLPSLPAIHLLPFVGCCLAACFLAFLLWPGFHANLPMLNSTWLGPVGETYTISPAGSGLYPFQDNAATIYTIANTGAKLLYRAGTLQSNYGLNCRALLCARF
jgi:hypothetical protein